LEPSLFVSLTGVSCALDYDYYVALDIGSVCESLLPRSLFGWCEGCGDGAYDAGDRAQKLRGIVYTGEDSGERMCGVFWYYVCLGGFGYGKGKGRELDWIGWMDG
jgi:hypothetical protein